MSNETAKHLRSEPSSDGSFIVGEPSGLIGFTALHVRSGANRIERNFPLDLRLEVDEWRLRVDRKSSLLQRVADQMRGSSPAEPSSIELRVRLRHCYVRYWCSGVSVVADSKYRSALEVGAYSERQSTSDKSAATKESAHNLALSAALASASKVSMTGGYRVGASWQGSATVERTVFASQDLYEVEAVPGGWRIGDRTHGDPLKRDGCLDGQYFSRSVEGRFHSCRIEFLPGFDQGSIRFAVTARDGLVVETLDGGTAPANERDAAITCMRNRIAAICIEQAGVAIAADELSLFEVAATCSAAADLSDVEA